MKVELIVERRCPNADGARARLRQALANCGLRWVWTEWQSDDPCSPDYARHHASPTILVDGRDIAESVAHDGTGACRLYCTSSGGFSGTPELAKIEAVLRSTAAGTAAPIKRAPPSLPVLGIALAAVGASALLIGKLMLDVERSPAHE